MRASVMEPPIRLGGAEEGPESRLEAEIRVLRALATERQPGIVRSPYLGIKVGWPQVVYNPDDIEDQRLQRNAEAELEALEAVEVFSPTPRDLSDWYVALRWFGALNPPESWHRRREMWTYNRVQRIMRWRSYGLQSGSPPSWEWIAQTLGRTRGQVTLEYSHGMDDVWRACRGLAVHRSYRGRST